MATTKAVRTFAGRLRVTQRTVQLALGWLWIVDAALQFQPRMFTRELVTQMISPIARGEPAPIAWGITTAAHLVTPDVGVWNFLIASLQLAIGAGLLWPRTVKPALVAMFGWCLCVWWVGEGFGQIFTGRTSALSGAPGAVAVYALIGVLVWPTPDGIKRAARVKRKGVPMRRAGFESAAGALGPFGVRGALAAWVGLWSLLAVLWLTPANRASTSIHDTLTGMAAGEPGWYAHFISSVARDFGANGSQMAWLLAAGSLVIGFGPLLSRRVTGFFVAGAVLELAFWVTGQAAGGILTGMGTDPNAGPLVALLALAVVPTVVPAPAEALKRPPVARRVFSWNPVATGTAVAGLSGLMLLSATYPETVAFAGGASPVSTMAGMPGMDNSGSAGPTAPVDGKVAAGSSAQGSASGTTMGTMKMASNPAIPGAMGATDPTWNYLGPTLPSAESNILTAVSNMTDAGHQMQTPSCTAAPTSTQLESALRLVQDTSSAVAPYKNLSAATAAGYIPVTSSLYPMVHYVNVSYMQDQYVLDPAHVQSLVYDFTPYGPVLVAAMYLMPGRNDPGPMPGGCLTQWHAHTNLCTSNTTHVIDGFAPCPAGSTNYPTPVMLHVWQVPVPGGPLALDPSDLQGMQAAVMAQQCGQAPSTTPPPVPSAGECPAPAGATGAAPTPRPALRTGRHGATTTTTTQPGPALASSRDRRG